MKFKNNRETKGLAITVSGLPGTGKSTIARGLADALNLRYISAGNLFRKLASERRVNLTDFCNIAETDPSIDRTIDSRTEEEARKGEVVIDSQLAAWIVGRIADIKILLTAPAEVRFRRIAQRDGIPFELARDQTLERELNHKNRYRKFYGINLDDTSIYDITFDTSLHSLEKTKLLIIQAVRELLHEKGR
jgi:cytidylate kinase